MGMPTKEQMAAVAEEILEARAEGREAAAKLCEEESKGHIADSVELEEKGLLNLANNAFERGMTCGLLADKIRGERKP